MAPKRSRKTRPTPTAKVTITLPATRPRNPLVVPAVKRVAGAHRKSPGAQRADERAALARALSESDREND